MASPTQKPLHNLLNHLSWLIGHWKSDNGLCSYPTIKNLIYGEEVKIEHIGQPNLSYNSISWNAETNQPMHREIGFFRVDPENTTRVALLLSHNNGITEIAEGNVDSSSKQLTLKSTAIGRMTFGKEPSVKKLDRTFKLIDNETLEQVVYMEDSGVPLTEHLKIVYKKSS